ncbi:MAG: NAD(P)-dependent oxidoreductase [Deltaproteobacteria bacterium]|nr:NAD(P)-dependent oxidoreductase [Deltaproteobacteria bacterium]
MPKSLTSLKDKKILVTGAHGFIGRHLTQALEKYGACVFYKNVNIFELANIKESFDLIYHLAAKNKASTQEEVNALFYTNVEGTRRVLEFCLKNQARFIFASSASVYQPSEPGLLLSEMSKLEPQSHYGLSKYLGEEICRYYARRYNVPMTILRIFNAYGPGQKTPFLIPHILENLSLLKPIELQEPHNILDFTHVSDIIDALIISGASQAAGLHIFNIGTGCGKSVYDMSLFIIKKLKCVTPIHMNQEKQGEIIKSYVANIKQVHLNLQWKPTLSLKEGLEKTIASYLDLNMITETSQEASVLQYSTTSHHRTCNIADV